MNIRTVILDFDGTCTDVEREAEGFLRGYKADLAGLIGCDDIEPLWAAGEAQVMADPSRHGMVIGGVTVAPPVDLYLLATAIGTLIEPGLGDEETERLFKDNYRFTTTSFRPDARAMLEALVASDAGLYIVTNSNPSHVRAKLEQLAPSGQTEIRLHGDARKFLVHEPTIHGGSPRFAAVPSTLDVPGWPRPVHPRRGLYFDVLESIWQETGSEPKDTLVIGDVFELDLLLPGTLGCNVHLVASPRSLPYERTGTEAFGGTHSESLAAVMPLIGP
jgi:FMN phosphatase YigB (HAD superfamily)